MTARTHNWRPALAMALAILALVSAVAPVFRSSPAGPLGGGAQADRKSTRLNSSHANNLNAVFCLKKNSANDAARTPACMPLLTGISLKAVMLPAERLMCNYELPPNDFLYMPHPNVTDDPYLLPWL